MLLLTGESSFLPGLPRAWSLLALQVKAKTNWLSMVEIWGFEASAMHAADQQGNKFFILDVRD